MSHKSAVAVFDLDHTLTHTNVSFAFGRYLYKQGLLSLFQVARLIVIYMLFLARLISVQTLHSLSFYRLFHDKKVYEVKQWAARFVKSHLSSLLRPEASKWIAFEKKRAHVLLLSTSPHFLVAAIAQEVGIEVAQGTLYTEENGRFTKVASVLDGDQKLCYLAHYLQHMQLPATDVSVYTDSIDDIALLTFATCAIVVNPGRKLAQVAKERSWKIIRGDS